MSRLFRYLLGAEQVALIVVLLAHSSYSAEIGRTLSLSGSTGLIPFDTGGGNFVDFNVNVDGDAFPSQDLWPFDPMTDGINETGDSAFDFFGVFQRFIDRGDPLDPFDDIVDSRDSNNLDATELGLIFDIADDSLSLFPADPNAEPPSAGDQFGILKGGDVDNEIPFDATPTFLMQDLDNAQTNDGSGPTTQVAEWLFDISGSSGDLRVSIDMAAMGDFESSNDMISFVAIVDGGSPTTLFSSSVDEAGSQLYTLESGTEVTLNDPLQMNGVTLHNDFQTLSAIVPGGSSTLALQIQATTNASPEIFAFREIVVEDDVSAPSLVGDYNDDGVVDAADYTVWRDNLGQDGAALANRDPANSGDVSVDDYNSWRSNFGVSDPALVAGQAAPEPSALLLLTLSAGLVRRGRRV